MKKIFRYLISLARPILLTSNLIVFTVFIMTGLIMYKFIGNKEIGTILFFTAFLYILFNKIESMDRRIKGLEETEVKQEGNLYFLENRIKELEEK